MKMEMPVEAEVAGTVAEILCAPGDAVTEGQPLVRLG
jgi:biotin carboxyl carrier protein